MGTRRAFAALPVVMAFLVTACAGPAASPAAQPTVGATQTAAATETPTEPAASPAASPAESPAGSPAESPAGSPGESPAGEALRIGVVTDVGTVNDKNFNEYTYVGATEGAAAIGAEEPPVFVPEDASEYATGLQAYVDEGFDIIVTAGFNLGAETTKAAKANPDVWFVGVDQAPICVDEEGNLDTTFTCAGDPATLLPRYIALSYQEDQAGYLVGMVAGSVTENGTIGAIGGITLCGPCIRYIQGYELGAQAVNPEVEVTSAYVTDSDFTRAFNDPVTGKAFGDQFIQQQDVDVLFQVAGKTGNGILDAACEAGILGIGVDVDQALSYPNAADCIITSATKSLEMSVIETIEAIADGTAEPGNDNWDASRDGVGIAPFYEFEDRISPELQTQIDEAFQQMKDGTLQTCPENCGSL